MNTQKRYLTVMLGLLCPLFLTSCYVTVRSHSSHTVGGRTVHKSSYYQGNATASEVMRMLFYPPSIAQKAQAQRAAQAALARPATRERIAASRSRYVAVPVKSKNKGQSRPDYVKYDVKRQEVVGKVAQPETVKKSGPNTVTVDGDDAFLLAE